jgi:hypothetical protein
MGEEILLLKIELDPTIASVYEHMLIPNFTMCFNPPKQLKPIENNYVEHLSAEKGRKTDKTNAFADDTTVATLCTYESLYALKKILADFAVFSGLNCNVEKTTITLIGSAVEPSQEILNLGFQYANSFKLLGITLSKNIETIYTYFDETLAKLRNIADFWSRLNLTLLGRIAVCKTFMLSLIGYIGCFLRPKINQLEAMQKIMDNFSIGKLKVANNRKYLKPSAGGLGLINLNDFISGTQCSWIKRVHQHGDDNWRHDLLAACYGNPCILNSVTFSYASNPVLHTIGTSYEKFSVSFNNIGKNYLRAFFFKNPIFVRSQNDRGLICENFFGRHLGFAFFEKIAKLRLEDLMTRGGLKSLDDINNEYDLNLTLVIYMRLQTAVHFFLEKKGGVPPAIPMSAHTFFSSFKKGSQGFRKIIGRKYNSAVDIQNIPSWNTFRTLTGLPEVSNSELKSLLGFWNFSGQPNTMREFIYKYFYNQLGLNTRVSHFVLNHSRNCTFCTLHRPVMANIPEESFKHLFFECEATKDRQSALVRKYFPEILPMTENEKLQFWMIGRVKNKLNFFTLFSVLAFQCLIWQMKLRKELKYFSTLEQNWLYMLDTTFKQSKKIRDARLQINYSICRRWRHGDG